MRFDNRGFSLVELVIAIAITAIIGGSVIYLMTFATGSSATTEDKIALQSEAQTVMNHITNHVIEGSSVSTSAIQLTIHNDSDDVVGTDKETVNYYKKGSSLLYGEPSTDFTAITDIKDYLLCEHVKSFTSSYKVNSTTNRKSVQVVLVLENEKTTFECKKEIYLRNQS